MLIRRIAIIKRVNRLISSFSNTAIPKKYLFIPWDGKTAVPPQEEISGNFSYKGNLC